MQNVKKTAKRTATIVLGVLLLIYILYHIANALKPLTELYTVTKETVKNQIELSGYIFRDETVLTSPSAGTTVASAKDGEKVAGGSVVALSYYIESEEVKNAVSKTDEKINILKKSSLSKSLDIAETDKRIAELRTEMAIRQNDAAYLKFASEELLTLMNKRSLSLSDKENYDKEIASLTAERTLLLSSLGKSEKTEAPLSGYFYSYTDGYENLFTAEEALNMTKEKFDYLSSSLPSLYNGAIGKISEGFKWYFVCKTDIESSEEIVEDKKYSCTFSDNTYKDEIKLTVEKKTVDYSDKTVIITFCADRTPENFDFVRHQRMKITVSETTGLKVPVPAVRVIDGNTGVYILYDGVARIRNINILTESGGYYIVEDSEQKTKEWLYLYDRIIMDEKNLYDGKVID